MKATLLCLFVSLYCVSATAVQSNDHWFNVETDETQKESPKKESYPYDSLESQAPSQQFRQQSLWSLDNRLLISSGFFADKEFWTASNSDRWFFAAGLQWRVEPWHRISTQALLLQNNSLFLSASWEYTPSRKNLRPYYGLGLAHQMLPQKQFSNLLEVEQYYLTANAGLEYLLESKHGLVVEAKALLGIKSYALQVTIGYLIPL